MMLQSLFTTLAIMAQAKDEDTPSLLQTQKMADGDIQTDSVSYCATLFHSKDCSVGRTTCTSCVEEIKAACGDRCQQDMSKSPWFLKKVAGCLLEKKKAGVAVELPAAMANRVATCVKNFDVKTCVDAVAHCTAIHADDGLASCPADASPEDQFNCVSADVGYLTCIAHNLDHKFCLGSSMGAGNCMKAGIECLDGGSDYGTDQFTDCFKKKRTEYFKNNPAQADVYGLCKKYYSQERAANHTVAMAKCGGCAMVSKLEFGTTNGVECQQEHCLKIPEFVSGVTSCMMKDEIACDRLSEKFAPGPFQEAEATCTALFPDRTTDCLRGGAECLALHPCGDQASCANDEGWFSCFAKKMDHTACEKHPAGMGICLKCGAGLVKRGLCSSAAECIQKFHDNNATVVGAHKMCVANEQDR